MNFRDRTLVSLASEDLRGGLLTNVALTNIAETAYRIEPGSMSAPWSATFDKLRIAPSFETHEQARAEMAFDANTGRIDGRLDRISQGELGVGPDAIWQGAVIGQGRVGGGRIAEVSGSFVGLGDVDQVIDSAGGVPAAGAARDDARLIEIARRLTDAAGVTGEIGPKDVADWVARSGAADLTTFLSETSTTEIGGGFGIRFISEAPGVDVPVQLTVDAVIHVADPDTNESSLVRMIRETRRARALFSASFVPTEPSAGIDRRVSVLGLWMVPLTWFGDQDWSGASPAARRDAANLWLREMGIAIAIPN